LLDLDGFRIDWARRNSTAKGSIRINNKSVSTYIVENLSPGTYDFTVVALNSKGVSSDPSNSVRRTVE
jgi:predicted phage tail protein